MQMKLLRNKKLYATVVLSSFFWYLIICWLGDVTEWCQFWTNCDHFVPNVWREEKRRDAC